MQRKTGFAATGAGIIVLLVSTHAHAADTAAGYTKLQALQSQVAILKQQLAIAKLKAGIKHAGNAPPTTARADADMPRTVAMNRQSRHSSRPSLPRILSIDGRGASLTAVLATSDGGQVVATRGQRLPGGYVVKAVTPDGVEVAKGKAVIPLPFGGQEMASAPQSPAAHGLPPGSHVQFLPMNVLNRPGQ